MQRERKLRRAINNFATSKRPEKTATWRKEWPSSFLNLQTSASCFVHDLILQTTGGDESVEDLVLLDGEGVEIDPLQAVDLALLHKAAELRH
ncbi:hypothetical protein ACFX10_000500 [Malus domestica]